MAAPLPVHKAETSPGGRPLKKSFACGQTCTCLFHPRVSYPQVEGAEVLVLQGFDFKRYCIRFMTIEHNGYEPMRSDIRDLMEAAGHAYAGRDGFDDFYTRKCEK